MFHNRVYRYIYQYDPNRCGLCDEMSIINLSLVAVYKHGYYKKMQCSYFLH